MKTTAEVQANPSAATPMELAAANIELLHVAFRGAVETNNEEGLRAVLDTLDENTAMVRRWLKATES